MCFSILLVKKIKHQREHAVVGGLKVDLEGVAGRQEYSFICRKFKEVASRDFMTQIALIVQPIHIAVAIDYSHFHGTARECSDKTQESSTGDEGLCADALVCGNAAIREYLEDCLIDGSIVGQGGMLLIHVKDLCVIDVPRAYVRYSAVSGRVARRYYAIRHPSQSEQRAVSRTIDSERMVYRDVGCEHVIPQRICL